jgi:hypothetical protein
VQMRRDDRRDVVDADAVSLQGLVDVVVDRRVKARR